MAKRHLSFIIVVCFICSTYGHSVQLRQLQDDSVAANTGEHHCWTPYENMLTRN